MLSRTDVRLQELSPAHRRRGRDGLHGQREAATLPSVLLLCQRPRVSLSHSATSPSSRTRHWKRFLDIAAVPALTDSGRAFRHPRPAQGLHPSPPLTPTRTHIYADTLDLSFLHEIVSQSKVSCCCCYSLTIIATLRGNFTIFGSHEPTIDHLCTNCHLSLFWFLFFPNSEG